MRLLLGLVLVVAHGHARDRSLPWKVHLGQNDTLVHATDRTVTITGPTQLDEDFRDGDRLTMATGKGGVLFDGTSAADNAHTITAFAGTAVVVGHLGTPPGAPNDCIELTSPNNGAESASIRVTSPLAAGQRKIIIRIKSTNTAAIGTDLIVTYAGSASTQPVEVTNLPSSVSGVPVADVTYTDGTHVEKVGAATTLKRLPSSSPINHGESLRRLTALLLNEPSIPLPFEITVAAGDTLYDDQFPPHPIPNPIPYSPFKAGYTIVCADPNHPQPQKPTPTVVHVGPYLVRNVSRLTLVASGSGSPLPHGNVPGLHIVEGGILVERGLSIHPQLLVITTEDATVFAGGYSPLSFRLIRDTDGPTPRTYLKVYAGHVEIAYGDGTGSYGVRLQSSARATPRRLAPKLALDSEHRKALVHRHLDSHLDPRS